MKKGIFFVLLFCHNITLFNFESKEKIKSRINNNFFFPTYFNHTMITLLLIIKLYLNLRKIEIKVNNDFS